MPPGVAVICEQTAQEPALYCRDCGHILRCLILGSICDFGDPADDESQSALLKGNCALQLDDARWTLHESRAAPSRDGKQPVDPNSDGRRHGTTILEVHLACGSVVKAPMEPFPARRGHPCGLPEEERAQRRQTSSTVMGAQCVPSDDGLETKVLQNCISVASGIAEQEGRTSESSGPTPRWCAMRTHRCTPTAHRAATAGTRCSLHACPHARLRPRPASRR